MKTKSITKFFGLILSVLMFVTLACGMTVTASAAEAGSAEIVGQNVNLGGDIEMKYYVELGAGVTIDQVKLQTVFLGVEKFLTTTETYTAEDGRTLYVFTLEGITPQCMGDDIDAVLYVDNAKIGSSLLDYSVKDNLVSLYNDETTDEKTKQLIIDTLEYGAAAQNYRGYKTDALVTADFAAATSDNDVLVPVNNPVLDDKSEAVSVSANVRYSTINYLLFGLTGADSFDGKVTIDDSAVTGTTIDGYYAVATGAISPENFHQDFTMKYYNEEADYVTLTYSVNDYCHAAYTNGATQNMKDLALALYNYGLSAHKYLDVHSGGEDTATCMHGKLCDVCGIEYDETTNPDNHESEEFTYTANADGTTHTKKYKCCGAVANAAEAHTIDSTTGKCVCGATCDHSGSEHTTATDKGDGTHSFTCTVCGATGSEEHNYQYEDRGHSIEETCANGCDHSGFLSITVPGGGDAVYTGNPIPVEVDALNFNASYTLTYDTYDETAPTNVDSWSFTLTVKDVTITGFYEITAVTPTVTAPTANTLTYTGEAQQLVSAGSANFGTMMYSLTENGEFTTTIPTGIYAGDYTVYYYAQGDGENILDSAKASVTVNIAKADPTATVPTGLTATYGQTLANVTLPAGWAWKDSSLSVGAVGANEFDAVFTPADTDNYNTATRALTVTVAKADSTVTTAPAAVSGLEYTGEAQALVTAGTASGGTVQYKLGENGTYSTTIPTETAVGEYTVYWKVVGDENHNGTDEQSITVTISQNAVAENEVTVGNLETSYTYTGGAITPEITVTVGGKTLTAGVDYDLSYGENLYVDEGTITITFKGNYSGEVTKTFTITSVEGTDDFISDWMPVG